jgi:hypothetical protein
LGYRSSVTVTRHASTSYSGSPFVNGISASQARSLNRDEKQLAYTGEAAERRDRSESSFKQRQRQYKNTKDVNDTADIVRVK